MNKLDALLFAAGSIWDVLDRDHNWSLAASFTVERQARAVCEEWNAMEGRERSKVVKQGA